MSIALFDPSIASLNLGDQIILDAVRSELEELMPHEQIINLPTQEVISSISIRHAMKSTYRLVGGTNLLSSHMRSYKQWQISLAQCLKLHDITLMGVGWWQYQKKPDFYTRSVLRRVLSKHLLHSVRDEYTKDKLNSIGITNTINTGCPTMWRLSPEHCKKIPTNKATAVVFTLTDYHPNPQHDKQLIDVLRKNYSTIYFWPQGSDDRSYLNSLDTKEVKIIQPSLKAFDALINSTQSLDFIGTRLHGGVRAMQQQKRSLIIAIDNRAKEISRDTGLNIAERGDIDAITQWINTPKISQIKMNWAAIATWKSQFLNSCSEEK